MRPEDLRSEFASALNYTRGDRFIASLCLAHAIIRVWLGDEWVKKYVDPATVKKISIFTQVDSPLFDKHRAISAYFNLAELLYNLQYFLGFDECVERLRDGDIDGAFAELEFGGMLARNRVTFRFVIPSGKKGHDYDIEIIHRSGLIVCADAKCKIDSTKFSRSTIENTLEQARKQFPKKFPCMIFVKVPGVWRQDSIIIDELKSIAREFLRKRKRVLLVNYYAIHHVIESNNVRVHRGYVEFSNDSTEFGNNIDWRMFRADWSGTPPWWQPIMYYPTGRPK